MLRETSTSTTRSMPSAGTATVRAPSCGPSSATQQREQRGTQRQVAHAAGGGALRRAAPAGGAHAARRRLRASASRAHAASSGGAQSGCARGAHGMRRPGTRALTSFEREQQPGRPRAAARARAGRGVRRSSRAGRARCGRSLRRRRPGRPSCAPGRSGHRSPRRSGARSPHRGPAGWSRAQRPPLGVAIATSPSPPMPTV